MEQGHQISFSATAKPMLLKCNIVSILEFVEDRNELRNKLRALILSIIKSHVTHLKSQDSHPTSEER